MILVLVPKNTAAYQMGTISGGAATSKHGLEDVLTCTHLHPKYHFLLGVETTNKANIKLTSTKK
jgi:hypothetical protein